MNEKSLIANEDGRLAVVENPGIGTVVLSPQALTAALLLSVAYYEPRKRDALKLALAVKAVTDESSLAAAAKARGLLASVRIDAEKDRKEFTAPFLDSQRYIKDSFDLLTNSVGAEEKRLIKATEAYAAAVEQKRQAQIAEQRKLEAERQAYIARQKAEADRLAKAAEDAAKAVLEAATPKAVADAEAAKEAAEDAQMGAELALFESSTVTEVVESVGKPVLDYVLEHAGTRHENADILAFAKAFPQMCNIGIRRSAVIAELNDGGCFGAGLGKIPKVPGLKIFEKFKTHTKVIRQQ